MEYEHFELQNMKNKKQENFVEFPTDTPVPWLDLRLTKEAMDFLWHAISEENEKNRNSEVDDFRDTLAGNISKSKLIKDKDNWFYENVLKRCTETIYFSNWSNYYDIHIANRFPSPVFTLQKLWVNYQKQHEFNPIHGHLGLFSFVVFMKIPTHWKEQHNLPWLKGVRQPQASDFQFTLGTGMGPCRQVNFKLSPADEGKLLFFPAWLAHQVYPFYDTEEERITVSGNIIMSPTHKNEYE